VARWTLPSLNYRRGLLRIYLVLSVLWIAGIVTISISGRPAPPTVYLDDHGNPIPSFDDFAKSKQANPGSAPIHDKWDKYKV